MNSSTPRTLTRAARALLAVLAVLLSVSVTPAVTRAIAADPHVALTRLSVEQRVEPLGIDVPHPRLGWVIESDGRDVLQESYRVVVSDPDGEVWDSGIVASAESVGIDYDGPALGSSTRYTWKVDVVTTAGSASASSWFGTGLLDEAAWHGAEWIGNDRPQVADGFDIDLSGASWIHPPYPGGNTPPGYFRTTFTVDPGKTVSAAQIVMTGDRGFTAFLNGVQVASGKNADDVWKKAARAMVWPKEGSNQLAVHLDNTAKAYGAIVGKLVVRYTDGTSQEVVTDGSWLSARQPADTSGATVATSGWQLAGYDDSAWIPATARAVYGGSPWGAQVSIPAGVAPDTRMTLDDASWVIPAIGTPNASTNPVPSALYRTKITTTPGKTVAWAQLAVTSDQLYDAYWNGQKVADGQGTNNEWMTADVANLTAQPGDNALAIATTAPVASQYGGILARVRIGYTDGSSSEWASDGSTRVLVSSQAAAPAGWTGASFDDSAWQHGQVQAVYRGWVYGDRVAVPEVDPTSAEPELWLDGAQWIWSDESGNPPAGDRAFRRTVPAPAGLTAVRAEAVVTGDDLFRLWLDGHLVGQTDGSVNQWQQSRSYKVDLAGGDRTVIAIGGTNTDDANGNSPAGVVAAVRITYSDGSTRTVKTDPDFLVTKTVPEDYADPDLDDSSWVPATSRAAFGSGAWGGQVKRPVAPPAPAPLLRHQFTLGGQVARATLFYAAGGYADFRINGEPIAADILSPGFTDYDDHVQYQSVDVTARLAGGANVIAAELGRGFYGMTGSNVWNWQNPPWHDEPVVRAVLRVELADGTTKDIVTDDTWRIHDGPTRFDDLYGGETYDASYVIPGYDRTGFDDSQWAPASAVRGPKGTLVAQTQQPIRVTEEMPAASMTEPVPGTYVIKFPKVTAGNVRVTAQGPQGTDIRFQYGEKLLDTGLVNFSNNGGFGSGFQTDHFVLAGTGQPETWNAHFSYKGFQYIQVTGWPGGEPPLSAFTALALHTDADRTGSFESSEPVMNEVHEAVVNTLYNNLHGIPTDTPMFEKNGWTGDAAVGAEMFLMNTDTSTLFAKWIRDIDDSRRPDGAPMVIAPSSAAWGDWGTVPTWHSAYILIPWWLYIYNDDRSVLDTYYDHMKAYVDLEYGRSPGGIADTRLGDWVAPEASPAGGNPPEDLHVSATAFLYKMLTTMEQMATLRGLPDDAEHFATQAATVKAAFNAKFLDTAAGYYRGTSGDNGYRQTHNVLALAFDLAPDDATAQRVAASIVADVQAKGVHLNTGSLGTKYLLPVLTQYGYADVAYALAVQTTYPSWGYLIDNGATSMWEHWSLDARSHGHYFLGTVDDWFYHDVAGIQPDELKGWKEMSIAPRLTGQVGSASGSLATPYGPVSSSWHNTSTGVTLDVQVPVGTTARVRVPAQTTQSVQESGTALASAAGVRSVAMADGAVEVLVGSGSYSFTVDSRADRIAPVLDGLAGVSAAVDAELSGQAATTARGLVEQAQTAVTAARDRLVADDATGAAQQLAALIGLEGDFDGVPASAGGSYRQAVAALQTAVHATIGDLLQVSASLFPAEGTLAPGERQPAEVRLTNAGTATLGAVDAVVAGERDGVTAQLARPRLATSLAPGADATGQVTLAATASALPGDYPLHATVSYEVAGQKVRAIATAAWHVSASLQVAKVEATPAQARPGGAATLAVTLRNTGSVGTTGVVEVRTPDGWQDPLPSPAVHVPAGGEVVVQVPVDVPWDAHAADLTTKVDVRVVAAGAELASGEGGVRVTLPGVGDAIDHIDLGEATSEQAHDTTASEFSGTSSEAGLTRRYAGHLHDFSWFEFDMAVTPGEPFLLRSTETYDRAQTKRYKVYVDGQEVALRQYPHVTGAGTETWQVLVDGALAAADGTVRVRYETQDDQTYYDPSIADVWTLPVGADTVAPQVTVVTDPALPERSSGWYRTPTVKASLVGRDDRGGAVTIEGAVDGPLSPYAAPYTVTGEGTHTVTYRAKDEVGNTTATLSTEVRIDSKAPQTTAATVGRTDQGTAVVRFSAKDATSGVAQTWYRVGSGEWLEGTEVELSGAGTYAVAARSVDVAGNLEDPVMTQVTVTGVVPPTWNLGSNPPGTISTGARLSATTTLSPATPAKGVWYRGKVWVSMHGTAPAGTRAVLQYRVDGGAWKTYTVPVAVERNGTTKVEARTITMTQSSAVSLRQVSIDKVKPKKVKIKKIKTKKKGKKRFVVFKAKEKHSGLAGYRYKLAGKKWKKISAAKAVRGVRVGAKKQKIKVRAFDRAGNTSKTFKVKVPKATGAKGKKHKK